MSSCSKCGAQLEDGAKFCPACGAPVEAAPEEPKAAEETTSAAKTTAPEESKGVQQGKDEEENKVFAIFAYISWLVLIPIFAAKDSPFARFHSNQGLVLAIGETILWVITTVTVNVLALTGLPWLVALFQTLFSLLNLAFIPFVVLGIVAAAKGEKKELPFIGSLRILK